MKKISAEIIADSKDDHGNRITSFILTYPRFIHAELMTHRMFSRNSASSRAIPFKKILKMVEEDPFYPIAWQKDHSGMQGVEYITDEDQLGYLKETWKMSSECMTSMALSLNKIGQLTKQLCNRLLEPFMWHTVLVTATEFSNFFDLRCPKYRRPEGNKTYKSRKDCLGSLLKDVKLSEEEWWMISESAAEIHIQALAESMWDSYNESIPKLLESNEWHIPFGDKMNPELLHFISYDGDHQTAEEHAYLYNLNKLKISVARCARLSYITFEDEINYEKDIQLYDQLFKNKHLSCFEHIARCMTNDEYHEFLKGRNSMGNYDDEDMIGWCNNFKGFIPYRYLIENNYKF